MQHFEAAVQATGSKPPVPSHRFQTVSSDVEMSCLNISHAVLRVSRASREASPIEPTVKLFELPEREVTP